MEIKDLIKCDNDNIIPRQSKMIANVLLSGTPNQIYNYKQISDEVYKKYGYYIRFNYLDKTASKKKNICTRTVGQYAGELSNECSKLGLPLISVMIFNGQLPGEGFYNAFPLCKELLSKGLSEKEISIEIRNQVADCFENNSWQKLIDYLNNSTTNKDSTNISTFDQKVETEKQNLEKLVNFKMIPQNIKTEDSIKYYEGILKEVKLLQRERNSELSKNVKIKDNYTCQGCGFHYENKIVQAHHLVPISESDSEREITENELVTLCPTCHSLAHLLLNDDKKYENKNILLDKLNEINNFYLIGK